MKHSSEARRDAIAALGSTTVHAATKRACLIFDLGGRLRALIEPGDSVTPQDARSAVEAAMAQAAEVFWSGEVWIDHDVSTADRTLFDTAWRQATPEPQGQNHTFVLERRLSKDAWCGGPLEPPWPPNGHTPPIVSFYSFKGGVGRTTALLAVAVNAARAGKKVVVVDLDLEAPGAGGLLQDDPTLRVPVGVVDYLLEKPLVGSIDLDIGEFCQTCTDARIIGDGEPIVGVPAGRIDENYLEKLARVNYANLYQRAVEQGARRSPLHQLLCQLRSRVKPDLVLVDSRAGLHDMGGLTLSGIAHFHVIFGLASEQSWSGLSLVLTHLGKDMILAGKPQQDCTVVHAMAPPQDPARSLAINEFKERSFEVFSGVYYDAPGTPNALWPVPDAESGEAPHYPTTLTWDGRVMGYSSLAAVAGYLAEGEPLALTRRILDKVGRPL